MPKPPVKGHADNLVLGDWNVSCAVCGRKFKASECVQLPAGIGGPFPSQMWVCQKHWRPRQPQDFVRGIPDHMAAPFTQPPVNLYTLNAVEIDDDTAEIDVCTYPTATTIITIEAGQSISLLTIPLGTGPAVEVQLNVYGYLGGVIYTTSSDACLPSAVTLSGINLPAPLFTFEGLSAVTVGISFTLAVTLRSSAGGILTGFTGSVTIALGENPGGAVLSGTLTQAAVAGVATFPGLSLDVVASGYTITATTAATLPATEGESDAFTVVAPAPLFQVQPSNAPQSIVISPAVEVAVVDAGGAVITSFTGDVTIAIGDNPGGGTLSGTLTVTCVAGIATFDDLKIDVVDDDYTLIATVDDYGTTSESNSFNITIPSLSLTNLYTLPGSNIYNYPNQLNGVGYTRAGMSFYNGVVYLNYGASGQFWNHAHVFNLASQNTPITDVNFGSAKEIESIVYSESQPPGFALLQLVTGPFQLMDFNGNLSGLVTNALLGSATLAGNLLEESVDGIFAVNLSSGNSPMVKFDNFNWVSGGAATSDTNVGGLAPGTAKTLALSYNGTVIDSRVYAKFLTSGLTPHTVGWVHSGTGALTLFSGAAYANQIASSMLAGQFGGGIDTVFFHLSGETNKANVLQKRDLDGNLIDEVTLSAYNNSNFQTLSVMAYDYVNDHVYVQTKDGPYTITCIDSQTMTVLATLSPGFFGILMQPIGHPSGGVILVRETGLYRVSIS